MLFLLLYLYLINLREKCWNSKTSARTTIKLRQENHFKYYYFPTTCLFHILFWILWCISCHLIFCVSTHTVANHIQYVYIFVWYLHSNMEWNNTDILDLKKEKEKKYLCFYIVKEVNFFLLWIYIVICMNLLCCGVARYT